VTYEELVRAIGPGFHPDLRGEDYTSLPDGITPDQVDEIVELAHKTSNPYQRAFEIFITEHWVKVVNP